MQRTHNVNPYRRPARLARDWQPRLSAIVIVDEPAGRWSFRLTDRATHLELALLRLTYGAETHGTDKEGRMIVRPRASTPRPTAEQLAERLAAVHERRAPRG